MSTLPRLLSNTLLITALCLWAGQGSAQQRAPRDLSLDHAISLARENSPTFQASINDQGVADWDVRSAYGALLPSASFGSGVSWQGSGEQRFGSITLGDLGFRDQPSYYFSNYSARLNYFLSGSTVLAPRQAKANREATVAQIRTAEANLVYTVTQRYIEVLRQIESLRLAERELERSEFNLRLAQGRVEVGTATALDVMQAEVAVGRAEISALTSETNLRSAKLRLIQTLGFEPSAQELELTTSFELVPPRWVEEELFGLSLDSNPSLEALRASHRASGYGVQMARSSYYPPLSLSAGISGFTSQSSSSDLAIAQAERSIESQRVQCQGINAVYSRLTEPLPLQDCSVFQFTPAMAQSISDGNNAFPFDFTRNPPSASLSISFPIFQGFSRQRQLETAKVMRDDLSYQVREQELLLRAEIGANLASVVTAYEAALIEESNQEVADEQLRLAREQYRLGLTSFIQLVEAETVKAQADQTRIGAIFFYHDALAFLESLVGAPLRNH